MIGERSTAVPIALWTSGLMIVAAVISTVVSNYWESSNGSGGARDVAEVPPAPKGVPQAAPREIPALSLASVAPILERAQCSALSATVDDHVLRVRGYVSEVYGIRRLQDELNRLPGVKTLNADVQQVGDDKCNVIQAFAPYWRRNQQADGAASIRIRTKEVNATLTEGESLIADIKTPDFHSHVNVDYYMLDGNVAHLLPNPRAKANQAPPNYAATIGTLGGWEISKPFGQELIVLLVTPVPLFEDMRPVFESRAEYLRAVEKQLGRIAAKNGPDHIVVDFVQITTKAR